MAKLFFSYSHKDEALRDELEVHLAMLKRQGIITAWHDRRIMAGSDLGQTISAELEDAQIILLLVSPYFLDSDYCYEKEMRRALEKHNEKTATVIPVILHPCDWQEAPFGHLRATPTDGKPVSKYPNQHEAFAIITQDVRKSAKSFSPGNSLEKPTHKDSRQLPSSPMVRSSNLRIKRKFDDHERDEFLENSYEYIARYFDNSLQELALRHPHIKTRFKRLDATSFAASIYDAGKKITQCTIWYGGGPFASGITYSNQDDAQKNSFNESLNVVDDGYTLQLKPMGMNIFGKRQDSSLSQQGAAEYYWEMLIEPLQR